MPYGRAGHIAFEKEFSMAKGCGTTYCGVGNNQSACCVHSRWRCYPNRGTKHVLVALCACAYVYVRMNVQCAQDDSGMQEASVTGKGALCGLCACEN